MPFKEVLGLDTVTLAMNKLGAFEMWTYGRIKIRCTEYLTNRVLQILNKGKELLNIVKVRQTSCMGQ